MQFFITVDNRKMPIRCILSIHRCSIVSNSMTIPSLATLNGTTRFFKKITSATQKTLAQRASPARRLTPNSLQTKERAVDKLAMSSSDKLCWDKELVIVLKRKSKQQMYHSTLHISSGLVSFGKSDRKWTKSMAVKILHNSRMKKCPKE